MIIKGELVEIVPNPSGLECSAKIIFGDAIGAIWCYMLLDKELLSTGQKDICVYREDEEPITISVGDEMDYELSIIFVNNFTLSAEVSTSFEQPINKSSHTVFLGIVREVFDRNFMCQDDPLGGNIYVDSIIPFSELILAVNKEIKFSGEIKAQPL
jgi:hypothetical protein